MEDDFLPFTDEPIDGSEEPDIDEIDDAFDKWLNLLACG